MKEIGHPNLNHLSAAWQTQGYLVLAMELAERPHKDRHDEAVADGEAGIPAAELLGYIEGADAARCVRFRTAMLGRGCRGWGSLGQVCGG